MSEHPLLILLGPEEPPERQKRTPAAGQLIRVGRFDCANADFPGTVRIAVISRSQALAALPSIWFPRSIGPRTGRQSVWFDMGSTGILEWIRVGH